jgi:hypothetical protein
MSAHPPELPSAEAVQHDDPLYRRWWLLLKASEALPLEGALALASRAESFVIAGAIGQSTAQSDSQLVNPLPISGALSDPGQQRPSESSRPAEKAAVLTRLADGATNGEVAAETRLTSRQVQGFRMQMARRSTKAGIPPGVEEIVRYLRHEGDVVVGADEGRVLVNGRFRLDVAELRERANRMRARQGKPAFEAATEVA